MSELEVSEREGNYRYDGEGRALYYREYRAKHDEVKDRLGIGELVPDDLEILYVGNNTLLPTSFDLRKADREAMGEGYLALPGKSAHVAFSEDKEVICGAIFDRSCRRTDHAYRIPAKELMKLGFLPFYAPTSNMPLHVRVIHETHFKDPEAWTIPFKAKVALVEAFQKHRIC